VGSDGKATAQAIKVSQIGHGEAVISDGLMPGQQVVVAGQYRLQNGSPVQATHMPPQSVPATVASSAAIRTTGTP